jgi:tRNA threonylcarbamoyladenosine biosynthesis protein TsaE
METVELLSQSEEETRAMGESVGRSAAAGDVITLSGDLGAGKTRFAQGVAAGIGIAPSVPIVSPTFTLLNEYRGRLPLYHLDLYRLAGGGDAADLGLEEYLYGNGVSVIEWPERLGEHLPAERLHVEILVTGDESRVIRLLAAGTRYVAMLQEVVHAAKKLLTPLSDS